MSLINPKNFTLPLTNIWHLATIAVVALLFGVYRAAGGGVDLEKIKKPMEVKYLGNEEYVSRAERGSREAQPAPDLTENKKDTTAGTKKSRIDPILGDLLDSDASDQNNRGKNTGKSSLDDIAKQLGVK